MKKELSLMDKHIQRLIFSVTGQKPKVKFLNDTIKMSWPQTTPALTEEERYRNIALISSIKFIADERFVNQSCSKNIKSVYISYDNTQYDDSYENFGTDPINVKAGKKYKAKYKSIYAIQVKRDNKKELDRFTGGGSLIVQDSGVKYAFLDSYGVTKYAFENDYIISNGNLIKPIQRNDFLEMYNPVKNISFYLKKIVNLLKRKGV